MMDINDERCEHGRLRGEYCALCEWEDTRYGFLLAIVALLVLLFWFLLT